MAACSVGRCFLYVSQNCLTSAGRGAVLGAGAGRRAVDKTDHSPCPPGAYTLAGRVRHSRVKVESVPFNGANDKVLRAKIFARTAQLASGRAELELRTPARL